MSASALLLTACGGSDASDEAPLIEKPEYKSANGIFDIDALEALGRVSGPAVSPDGSTVLYSVSYESVEQNKSNAELWLMDIDGSNQRRITKTAKSESGAAWIDGGKSIAFLYEGEEGNPQVWIMNPDGSGRKQISHLEGGAAGFLFSPDGSKVVLIGNVKYSRTAADLYPDLPKATGRVIDDLMYKHWDEWVTEIPHPFVGNFDGKEITDLKDIMADEPYESPMKPFGGIESFAWTPDGKGLVYTSRKKTGMEYAISTNSDLYLYNLEDGTTRNLTEGMMGYDTCPAFSPDGRYMAWLSMERDLSLIHI